MKTNSTSVGYRLGESDRITLMGMSKENRDALRIQRADDITPEVKAFLDELDEFDAEVEDFNDEQIAAMRAYADVMPELLAVYDRSVIAADEALRAYEQAWARLSRPWGSWQARHHRWVIAYQDALAAVQARRTAAEAARQPWWTMRMAVRSSAPMGRYNNPKWPTRFGGMAWPLSDADQSKYVDALTAVLGSRAPRTLPPDSVSSSAVEELQKQWKQRLDLTALTRGTSGN